MIRKILGISLVLLCAACSKNEVIRLGSASLVIFNGIPGSNPLRTNFSTTAPAKFSTANILSYAFFEPRTNFHQIVPGNVPLQLYHQPDTMPKSTPLYTMQLDLAEGSIHSLFLTGTTSAPESVLVKDVLPFYPAGDSAMGIRFVNLLPDSIPVRIKLLSNTTGAEVNGLPYKGVSEFKSYPVKMNVADYVFEFRHATTGDLIASYTTSWIANDGTLSPNTWVYKNFTLALIGKLNGAGAQAPRVVLITYARSF